VADDVLVRREGALLRVTLNRPGKHNPLSRPVLARLRQVFEQARDDAALACAIITGAGEKYFAAGGDLRDLGEVRTDGATRAMAREARAALDSVREFPLPVIALLNGDAIGGGAELALACDLRVMCEGTHIGYVHGRLAITPAWGGGTDLAGVVGPSRALRMIARAEMVSARTAVEWGLADVVAARNGLEAALQEFVAPLLAQPQRVLRACKALALSARRGRSRDEQRALEEDNLVASWTHSDHWVAVDRIFARRAGG
jgi:enoyl-CoA hydratase